MLLTSLKEAVIIVLTAIVVATAVYLLRPDKIAGPMDPPAASQPQPGEATGFREISIDAARSLFDAPNTLFADARPAIDFAAGHVYGARNLVVADQEQWLPAFLATTDPATVIITYCDGENCHLAPELAELLYFNGYDNVYYLKNGWTRWRERGFPTE